MYKQVAKMTPVARLYEAELLENGHLSAEEIQEMKDIAKGLLEEAYAKSKTLTYRAEDWVTQEWAEIMEHDIADAVDTGIAVDRVRDLGLLITQLPQEAEFHRLVRKIFETRNRCVQEGRDIDWGTAEALAFGSLIQDGYKVRISGQDVERGTFSHRHAHVFYQDRDGCYIPLNNVAAAGPVRNFIASNSRLSEFAVLGYELGYAQASPNSLNIWEAQFGDFANGA